MTLKDLIVFLVRSGYRYHVPASSTWKMAFISDSTSGTLCVLIRKNGIDLRLDPQLEFTTQGTVSMSGGTLYRNHYNQSKNLITLKIKIIASCFVNGKIHSSIATQDGRSYTHNDDYGMHQYLSRIKFEEKKQRLMDLKDERSLVAYARENGGLFR